MDQNEMKIRTKQFALRIINLVDALPGGRASGVIGYQLMKCRTSVGANYRSACRAKSPADFISKLGTVEEEADESIYWMELVVEAKLMPAAGLKSLMREADEITAIIVASIKTARRSIKPISVPGIRTSRKPAIRNPNSEIDSVEEL